MKESKIKNPVKAYYSRLRGYCESYYDIQKVRIAASNQLRAWSEGVSEQEVIEFKAMIVDSLLKKESEIRKVVKRELKNFPIYVWLRKVKGIGSIMAMGLISYIQDISRFPTISKLWRYAGMGVVNGRAERYIQGVPREKNAKYNPKLKALCWKIGNQMILANSPYRKIFDEAREKYREKWLTPEDCGSVICKQKGQHTEGHNVSAAKRKMVKVFLSHL